MNRFLIIFSVWIWGINPLLPQEIGIINDPDDYCNLREGPGTEYQILARIYQGSSFEFYRDPESDWWKVKTGSNQEGFVHKSRIQPYGINYSGECSCVYPYGQSEDQPDLVTEIGGKEILICGYLLQRSSECSIKISEFSIVDCSSGELLKFYGAVQTCTVSAYQDRLEIVELMKLPSGESFEWEILPYQKEVLKMSEGSLQLEPPELILDLSRLSNQSVIDFERSLPNYQGIGYFPDLETFIGKLAVCSMKGNERCRMIFSDLEGYIGFQLDGAHAEFYKELAALLKKRD